MCYGFAGDMLLPIEPGAAVEGVMLRVFQDGRGEFGHPYEVGRYGGRLVDTDEPASALAGRVAEPRRLPPAAQRLVQGPRVNCLFSGLLLVDRTTLWVVKRVDYLGLVEREDEARLRGPRPGAGAHPGPPRAQPEAHAERVAAADEAAQRAADAETRAEEARVQGNRALRRVRQRLLRRVQIRGALRHVHTMVQQAKKGLETARDEAVQRAAAVKKADHRQPAAFDWVLPQLY